MRIEIITNNFKPKDTLKDLLEKKISKFDKYFRKDVYSKVRLAGIGNNKYSMEITIISDGIHVRAENTSENMYDNIDIVLPKIERQIAKFRKNLEPRLNKGAFDAPYIYDTTAPAEADDTYGVPKSALVKKKKFELAMLDVDGAIAEMELLGHDFYVFVNAEDSKTSVLYKRHDGNYGLISPEN